MQITRFSAVAQSAARMLAVAGAATLLALAAGAVNAQPQQAQRSRVTFPDGLHWQPMAGVSFDFPPRTYGTPAQRKLSGELWKKELAVPGFVDSRGRRPAFILLSSFDDGPLRYIFTSLSAAIGAYPNCDPPPNGGDATTPIYYTCPMRVVAESRKTGEQKSQEFPDYCNLFPADDGSTPGKSDTQIAFDKAKKTVYFRVIQYSKPRPECNRAIRLG